MSFFKKQPVEDPFASIKEAQQIYREGVTTLRDIIAPEAMEITFNYIRLGNYFIRSFFVLSYPRYLYTEWLSPVINFDVTMDTSLYIYPINTQDVMKKLKTQVGRLESRAAMEAEKGMVRDPQLETAYEDIETLRDLLQKGESKLFHFALYFTVYAKSKEELEENTKRLESALNSQLVYVKQSNLQQEQGFDSCLPMAKDKLKITHNMDTGALSTCFPFISSELTSNSGILYGINRHNNGLILFDRFELENANSVVLAKSGAGKSYAVKLEILRSLMFGTEVIVIDPENEYEQLCKAVGGSYLSISLNSPKRINPFDLPVLSNKEEGRDALRSNVITLHGLMSLILGKMNAKDDDVMDKALIETYASKGITADPATHHLKPPTMEDLQKVLMSITGGEELAMEIRKFTTGSFAGLFNEQTNIELNKQMIVFSTRDLEEELRPIAMYIILNYIWNKVKSDIRRRILVIDESWYFLKYPDSAQFIFSIAKRSRKYYLGLTTISQDVEDFLGSPYGKAIVTNSSLSLLLKQHPAAVDMVAKTFNLTEAEKYLLLNAEVGEGLFFAGLNHVAIATVPSYSEDMLVTINPKQLEEMAKDEAEED